jgi:hypothetical protein
MEAPTKRQNAYKATVTQRMADLRRALLAWAAPPQRPGIEAMTDTQMVSTAFYQTGKQRRQRRTALRHARLGEAVKNTG